MSRRLEITGQRFGRLVATMPLGSSPDGMVWEFFCDCGERVEAVAKRVKYSVRSCGCLAREVHGRRCSHLNLRHGMTETPTWNSWSAMLQRCCNPNNIKFPNYGGRGIKVCERWEKFENFIADMGERPKGKSLDRWPNPAGNYEPGNCRWATPLEQRHNRRGAA